MTVSDPVRFVRALRLVTAAAAVASRVCAPAAGQASFFGLGDLPGGDFLSIAYAVADDGNVVAGMSDSGWDPKLQGPELQAFRWRLNRGMEGLGFLPGRYAFSIAYGVSADGTWIVGEAAPRDLRGWSEAFRWSEQTGMEGIGDLGGPREYAAATCVSRDGRVALGESRSPQGMEAFIWRDGPGMSGLSDLPGGAFWSGAHSMTADYRTIAGWGTSWQGLEACVWRDEGDPVGLGDLPGGGFESAAPAITSSGHVIAGTGTGEMGLEPMRWTPAAGMNGLGDLPGGQVYGGAFGLSDDGWRIVGVASGAPSPTGFEAFIWDPLHGMRSLKGVLERDHGLRLAGWIIDNAQDITPDGRVIVGGAFNPSGQREAFYTRMPAFCYADCDESTGLRILDAFDFLCFQQHWLARDLYSDCDQDGAHDIFDYLCFLNQFAAGCP